MHQKEKSRVRELSIPAACRPSWYLAGPQDLEHERQAVRDQLQRVLLLVDAAELLQEALDERPAVLVETRAQRLQPSVQSPGHPWEETHTREVKSQVVWLPTGSARLLRSIHKYPAPFSSFVSV